MKKRICGLLILAVALTGILLTGCSNKSKENKVSDLDYTVIGEDEIPEELRQIIEDKKQTAFKLSYSSGDYLYIAVGYGTQRHSGYSIAVNDLFLSDNGIYLNTDLLGPSNDEIAEDVESFPFIVIKMPYREESVIFNT